ncbi:MAG: hypothetical protein U5L01_13320 [Rheinheimera sp.]|nr:hypothetical protein [Rheinheimera sp.]
MIALTIFIAAAISSAEAMSPDEYGACLSTLQTLSMSPLAVNGENIQCFEVRLTMIQDMPVYWLHITILQKMIKPKRNIILN